MSGAKPSRVDLSGVSLALFVEGVLFVLLALVFGRSAKQDPVTYERIGGGLRVGGGSFQHQPDPRPVRVGEGK